MPVDYNASVEATSEAEPRSHAKEPQDHTAPPSPEHYSGPAEAKEPRRRWNPWDEKPEPPPTKKVRGPDGRWLKGCTGNPKGRPKVPRVFTINDRLLRDSFLAQMMTPVKVRMNGKLTSISTVSAIVARQIEEAKQGKRLPAKWCFEHFQNYVNDHERWQVFWADVSAQDQNRILEEVHGTPEKDLPPITMPEAPDTAPAGRRGRSRRR